MKKLDASDLSKENGVEGTEPRKIRRTLSSMIKIMETTEEERSYRKTKFDSTNFVKKYQKYLKCTKCDMGFQNRISKGETLGVHPLLSVLLCDSCKDYYGDGDFSLDSEGEDKYCRWCGEGGTIFSCSKCICGFCDICIRKHFGEDELKKVESDDDWTCYFCNNKPLWDLRSVCSMASEVSKAKREELRKSKVKNRKRKKHRKSSEMDDDETSSDSSCNVVAEREILKKQKKFTKTRNNYKRDSSSSSEADKENSSNSKKRRKIKKKPTERSQTDSGSAIKSKPNANSDSTFANKRELVLNKLKSIWKLTEAIASVSLSLSKKRLKHLENSDCFNNLEDLQKEHQSLKSFTTTLAGSLKTAASSVDSFKEDLSFESATDETELFQAHEQEIKTLAEKLEGKSNSEMSTDSDCENSSRRKSGEKKNNSKQPRKSKKGEENEDKEKEEKMEKDTDVKLSESLNDPKSVTKNSKSDEVQKDENSTNKESVKLDNCEPRKPLLRVKAFARMLDDNILVQKKENKIVEVYDIASDKSGDEFQDLLCHEKIGDNFVNEKVHTNDISKKPRDETSAKTVTQGKNSQEPHSKDNCESSSKEQSNKSKDNTSDIGKRNEKVIEANTQKELEKTKESKNEGKNPSNDATLDKNLSKKSLANAPDEENREDKKSVSDKRSLEKEKHKSDQESSDESIVAKRRKKKRNEDSDSSDQEREERAVKKTRSKRNCNQAKSNNIFEKFKEKRKSFIKSRNESLPNNGSPGAKTKNAELPENSKKEENNKIKQKKKFVIDSSDDEQEKKDGKEDEESEMKVLTSSDESEVETEKRQVKRKKKNSDSIGRKGENSSDSSDEQRAKKKGRRNINRILKKDSLKVETKEALQNERTRRKRIEEKQKVFEKLFPEEDGRIILDFDPKKKEPLVTVHKKLAKKLKPHQVKGVKFMWDNCFESVKRLEVDSGTGCILAHCMGLGKTLQVVTLVHTVMTHDLGVNTVLVVCPLSAVSNWVREFEVWLEDVNTEPIVLFDLVRYKKQEERYFHLKSWHENGGVLVISYDLFRTLTKIGTQKRKTKFKLVCLEALLDPGPDLVVCDEGHLLKNEDTALSKCMSQVKTSRRIVLTGTPLQNNLLEYHCMVQFVKPNILGTRKEFCNRFVNPINNGQFEDSTLLDVKVMKQRSHVLHSMLEGCIQRFDYSVLTPFLPEKHEYVLSISLTEKQTKAYKYFLMSLSAKSQGTFKGRTLFHDYNNLHKIWTHPKTLLMQSEREAERDFSKEEEEEEDSLKDFIVTSDEESGPSQSESSDSIEEVVPKKRILRSNANDPDVVSAIQEEEKPQSKHWWDEFFDEDSFENLKESNKLILLFSLLKHCKEVNDKILVFSQSLYSLDVIEYFLNKINDSGGRDNESVCGYSDTWHLGTDYFRLDGSTSSDQRASWCNYFNKESNTRARLFLISTRAGGLGINLYGANRVVIFDASWNPSHDLQSIFRVYRFGQKKTCYIYRFLAEGTMEEKIYERQVTKLSLAHRVVDEHQIERHYTMGNLLKLYEFNPTEERNIPVVPKDSVLAELLQEHRDIIVRYHEHDSLLENKEEEELTEEERKAAWKEYEEEKERKLTFTVDSDMQQYLLRLQQAYPGQSVRILNPAYVTMNSNQTFKNPMSNVPFDVLERGIKGGVTPLPNEAVDSYVARIIAREVWIKGTLPGN